MRLHPSLLLLALLAYGCDFGSDPARGPSFPGTWKKKTDHAFTRADTLYRDGLRKHMAGHGIDLDRYFEDFDLQGHTQEEFQRLLQSYSWSCPDGVDCDEVLWREVRKSVFTRDSVAESTYRDGELRSEWRNAYRFDKDSLYFNYYDTLEFSMSYRFLDRDTLVLGYFEGLADTLIRLE